MSRWLKRLLATNSLKEGESAPALPSQTNSLRFDEGDEGRVSGDGDLSAHIPQEFCTLFELWALYDHRIHIGPSPRRAPVSPLGVAERNDASMVDQHMPVSKDLII